MDFIKSKLHFFLFLFYLGLVLWFTVFSRTIDFHTPQLALFWSYKKWIAGDWNLGREILLNMGMFVPFGFLLTASLASWKRRCVKVLVAGIIFSCAIEILQFVLWRGLFELDDIVNNAAGAVLGYWLYRLFTQWVPEKYFAAATSFFGTFLVFCGSVTYFNLYKNGENSELNLPRNMCFQLESAVFEDETLLLSGFTFFCNQTAFDEGLVLKSTQTGQEIKSVVKYGLPRPDVNAYFRSDNDYSKTGFSVAVMDVHPEEEYEIFMKVNPFVIVPTGVYITGTNIHYVKQKDFVAPSVAGTDLAEIVNHGYLRVYRPDFSCYVYQYKGDLYWIADRGFAFEKDGTTYIQYHLWTTQVEKLPQKRLKNKWYFDNIGGYFEKYEITGRINCGRYRVSKRKLPTEYAVTSVNTGYYKNGKWIWKEYFRPVYEFGERIRLAMVNKV